MARKSSSKIEAAIDGAVLVEEPVPVDVTPEAQEAAEQSPPDMTDPEWQAYVLGHLGPKDFDPKGNPFTASLRRLAMKLLGPIVAISPRVIQAPDMNNGLMATVEVHVTFAWGGDRGDIRTFGDVTDVYSGNSDPAFARFPSASAKTKAEGRALKTALGLEKEIYTSEEMTEVPVSEAGLDGMIVLSQQRFIDTRCKTLDIDVNKFISMGDFRFKHISHVPQTTARKMFDRLHNYESSPNKIPEEVKGYDPNWRQRNV